MITKADYDALSKELATIEKATGTYLADPNVDHENIDATWKSGGEILPTDPEFWSHMYSAACYAAGFRAKDAGLDINALIGRDIY
jgi:hypothetical protein